MQVSNVGTKDGNTGGGLSVSCLVLSLFHYILEGDSISDAQPPSKRINTEATASSTSNSGMINGLEVS